MKISILKNIIIFILCISFFAFAKDESSKIEYVSVEEIREMAKKEDIRGVRQYNERRKKNPNFNGKRLPSLPSEFYENWPSWGDVLPRKYMTLEEIGEMVEEEDIRTSRQYTERREKNPTFNGKILPAHPETFYKNWPSWGNVLPRRHMTLEELKEFILEENIQTSTQYYERRNKNRTFNGKELPANPSEFYENWPSWGDVLPRKYMTLEELKEFALEENIQTGAQYRERRERDPIFNGKIIPSNPDTFYPEWTSWNDVLVKNEYDSMEYTSVEEIREMAKKEDIQTGVQYHERRNKNRTFNGKILPAHPETFYKNWPSWGVALGKNKCEKVFNSSVRAS